MTSAYEAVRDALQISDTDDPRAEMAAKKIIGYARSGVRDPIKLRDAVLRELRLETPKAS